MLKKNKEDKKEIYKNNSKKDKELINKNILILEDKLKKLLKMKLFNEAEIIKKEIENEKNKWLLEIVFNKEKNELFQKFKNQLNDFKMFKNKNQKNNKKKYILNNSEYLLNKSFNKDKLNKKLEDDEDSIVDNKWYF